MGPRDHCVYILTCRPTNMKYVGRTNDFSRRINEHRNATDGQTCLQQAISQYGLDSFSYQIHSQNLTLEEATRLEADLIARLNTYLMGYNMTTSG